MMKKISYKAKIIEEARHYIPANKQWKNSVYSFNKNNVKLTPFKDLILNKLIRSYFYLNDNQGLARSRRMRSSKANKLTNKIFISKPEIKQSNDKTTFTIYVFNKEKESLIKRIFVLTKNLIIKAVKRNNILLTNDTSNKITKKLKKITRKPRNYVKNNSVLLKNRLSVKTRLNKSFIRTINSENLFGLKVNNKMQMLMFAFKNFLYSNRFKLIKSKFFFVSIRYMLSLVNINVKLIRNTQTVKVILSNGKDKIVFFSLANFLYKFHDTKKNKFIDLTSIQMLDKINHRLFLYLKSVIYRNNLLKNKFFSFFSYFYKNNYIKFLTKELEYDLILVNYYMKLLINRLKFEKFLPAIKNLITMFYNKKAELNIINQKYRHLNSDIFVESLANNLKKKVNVLKILDSFVRLVKIPSRFLFKKDEHDINKLDQLNFHRKLNIENIKKKVENKDILDTTIKNLFIPFFSHDLINLKTRFNKTNKIANILNTINYKWVTGTRLELKGRLTRRYTASRSFYKLKIKGNIGNMDYLKKIGKTDRKVPNLITRNQIKSNLQYTLITSKRRIGAFGVKGWISNY